MRNYYRNKIAVILTIIAVMVIYLVEIDYITSLKGIYPVLVALGYAYIVQLVNDILK